MTAPEKRARKTIEEMDTARLLDQFELTSDMTGEHVPTVRGWLMDEIEKRYPVAFDNGWTRICRKMQI
jgi:hypothetical protein